MNQRIFHQVFIINRYCETTTLCQQVHKNTSTILIVSTHHLFPKEKNEIKTILSRNFIEFLEFDHWNNSIDKVSLDEKAFQISKKRINYLSIYHSSLKISVIYLKNKFVYEHLISSNYISETTRITVFCSSYDLYNLGVSYKFWKLLNVKIIDPGTLKKLFLLRKKITNLSAIKILSYYITAAFQVIRPIKIIKVKDQYSYYILDTHRVHLKPNLKARTVWFIPLFIHFKRAFLAAPIHSKSKVMNLYPFVSRKKTVLISDAYRPSTYPHYFALGYFGSNIIVKNKLDQAYFNKAKIKTLPFDELIENKRMHIEHVYTGSIKKSICFSLNHAVDFCSVISRSDTDKLIETAVAIAKEFSQISVVIRLHPTSNSPQAEGLNWSLRIQNYVELQQLGNLKISDQSLEQDWINSSIFISEYSLSVVDAIAQGNFAIFVNMTRRRSFAFDLKKANFIEVYTYSGLIKELKSILNNPTEASKHLNDAAVTFNNKYYV